MINATRTCFLPGRITNIGCRLPQKKRVVLSVTFCPFCPAVCCFVKVLFGLTSVWIAVCSPGYRTRPEHNPNKTTLIPGFTIHFSPGEKSPKRTKRTIRYNGDRLFATGISMYYSCKLTVTRTGSVNGMAGPGRPCLIVNHKIKYHVYKRKNKITHTAILQETQKCRAHCHWYCQFHIGVAGSIACFGDKDRRIPGSCRNRCFQHLPDRDR